MKAKGFIVGFPHLFHEEALMRVSLGFLFWSGQIPQSFPKGIIMLLFIFV